MHISTLEIFGDTGFMENGAEVPSLEDSLSNPILTLEDLHPSRDDLFSSVKLKTEYTPLIAASYLRITYDKISYPIYAWIDSVSVLSDTQDPVTRISFHIDLWRTYLSQAKLAYGLVSRRPRGSEDPIQNCSYRYRLAQDFTPISYAGRGSECYWIIINATQYSKSGSTDKISRPKTMIAACSKTGVGDVYVRKKSDESTKYKFPTLPEIVTGTYDELLGVDPSSISSVFVSPYPPLIPTSGTGTSEDPYVYESSSEETEYVEYSGDASVCKIITAVQGFQLDDGLTVRITRSDGTVQAVTGNTNDIANAVYNVSGGWKQDLTIGSYAFKRGDRLPFLKLNEIDFGVSGISEGSYLQIHKILPGYDLVYDNVTVTTTTSGTETTVTLTGTMVSNTIEFKDGKWGGSDLYIVNYGGDPTFTWSLYIPKITGQTVTGVYSYNGTQAVVVNDNSRYDTFSATVELETTDTREAVMLDMDGNPVWSLPWGRKISSLQVRPVISMVSAFLELRADGADSRADGTCAVIPLPSVDITTNSWSSYVFSGQREYDIEQRRIAAKQALIQGITGAAESTVSAGIMGGIGAGVTGSQASQIAELINGTKIGGRGSAAKKAQMISGINGIIGSVGGVGAIGSAGAMLGVSVGSALIDYALTTHYNQQLQAAQDLLTCKQSETLISAGSGWDWMYFGREPGIVYLVPDAYSLDRFENNISYAGIEVSEPTSDCTALVQAGGPLQISQLLVTGDIPPQAKAAISETLEKGVRIVTKNKENTQ